MKQSPPPAVEAAETTAWDSQAFKQQLLEHVRAQGGSQSLGDPKQFFNRLVKDALETLLEAEMEEHLGYAKHAPAGRGSGNSRNGSTPKTVRGDFGQARIDTPRDRDGSFDPKIVPKREASLGDFTEKIISLYTRGMTTREIEEHLLEMYGIEVSAQFISRATDQVQQQIAEWHARPLERLYPVVYVDGLRVAVRTEKGVVKKCVYVVLGVSTCGRQEVLGLWIEETEGARFWLKVFNDLKARGVADILILCGDGLKGLPEAVASVYPKTDVQLCVVHQIRNVTKFVSYKDRKPFCADMRGIYAAPTVSRPPPSPSIALRTAGAPATPCPFSPGEPTGTPSPPSSDTRSNSVESSIRPTRSKVSTLNSARTSPIASSSHTTTPYSSCSSSTFATSATAGQNASTGISS